MSPTTNDVEFAAMAEEMLAEDGRSLTLRKITRIEGTDVGSIVASNSDSAIKGFPTAIDLKQIDGELTKAGDVQVIIARKPLRTAGLMVERGDQILGLDADDATRPATVVKVQAIASGEQDAAFYAFARLS